MECYLSITVRTLSNVFQDDSLLLGKLYMRHMHAGMTLLNQGDQNTGLYFVVMGQLVVLQHTVGTDGIEVWILLVSNTGLSCYICVRRDQP